MSHLEFDLPNLVAVLIIGHLLGLLVEWIIHYLQHQRILGFDFHRIHLRSHHDVKLMRSDPRTHRRWQIVGHVQWLCMIGVAVAAYVVLLPAWVATIGIAQGLVAGVFTYYIHREYTNRNSWLRRYRWFRHARVLHSIHHGSSVQEFARSRNLAIGGPLTGALMDHVFRTFQGKRARSAPSR